jgi:hypothetical protein
MANRFWVTGGTGNWNSITNWSATTGGASGASVPGIADIALLDASSGAGTVTLDISPDILSMNNTGFTGTLAFGTNTISTNGTGTQFTGSTTMTVSGTPQVIITNNSATARTITPTAVTEANSISFRITAGTGTLSINTGAVRNLDFTDGTNPTGYAGAAQNMVPTIYGNFKASTGMTKVAGTGTFTFAATSGTKTITTAAVVFDNPFTFNGVGGTWQLQDALTSGATRSTTLTNGVLDLSSYTLTTGIFSSSNSNTRTLAFGTGKIVLTGSSATIFTTATATGLTVTGTAPLVETTYSGSIGTRAISMGAGGETNAISVNVNAGSDTVSFGGASGSYKDINFTGFTGIYSVSTAIICYGSWNFGGVTSLAGSAQTTTFSATSGTKTITSNAVIFPGAVTFNGVGGIWVCADALTLGAARALTMTNGTLKLAAGTTSTVGSFVTSGTNAKYLLSSVDGTQATISDASGTNTVTYLSIKDSIATGGAIFNAIDITNVNAGNNTGWVFKIPDVGYGTGNGGTCFGFGFKI